MTDSIKTTILILSWAAICMGVIHIGLAFPIDEFRLGHLWFIGSAIAIVFAGFINLLGQVIEERRWYRILVPLANFMMCGLFIVATVVLKEPQVYFGIALFGLLGILTIRNHTWKGQP